MAIGWFRATVFDCDDHEALAAFWSRVLDVEVAERQDGWIQLAPDPGGASMAFQPRAIGDPDGVGDGRPGMRLRPDLVVTDVDAAREAVEALGGTTVREVREANGDRHLVMADPEGNQFCLVGPLPPDVATHWTRHP